MCALAAMACVETYIIIIVNFAMEVAMASFVCLLIQMHCALKFAMSFFFQNILHSTPAKRPMPKAQRQNPNAAAQREK